MSCIVFAVFEHALCRSCRQYVLLSSTMLCVGLVSRIVSVAVFNHARAGLVNIICHLLL